MIHQRTDIGPVVHRIVLGVILSFLSLVFISGAFDAFQKLF